MCPILRQNSLPADGRRPWCGQTATSLPESGVACFGTRIATGLRHSCRGRRAPRAGPGIASAEEAKA